MLGQLLLMAYLPVKLFIYMWWCYRGITYLDLHPSRPKLYAALFGLLRFVMGLVIGVGVLFLITMLFAYQTRLPTYGTPSMLRTITYVAIYFPVQWLEWGFMEFMMNNKSRTLDFFFLGSSSASRRWRLGGLIIFVLFDVPFILGSHGFDIHMC